MPKNISLILLLFVVTCAPGVKKVVTAGSEQDTLRVLSYNIWVGGQPLEKSAEVIRVSGAKIVGIQEACSYNPDGSMLSDNGLKIAETMGWNYYSKGRSGILTSYAIADTAENKLGIKLNIGDFNEPSFQDWTRGSRKSIAEL